MAMFSAALAARIARHHGIVSTTELVEDGFSRDAIRRQLDAGVLITVHKGVLRVATSPDTFESRCAAACIADPHGIVSGVAAARLWAFHHTWRPDQPYLLIQHGQTPITHGVVLRRSNVIDVRDVVERSDGIRIASPPRAWFDCARDIDDQRFERLTEWVLDHHTTLSTLWETTRRLEARGRPGLARVRRVMSRRSDWQRPAGSGLELSVLRALEQRGIPLVAQFPLVLADGSVIHPDGADPDIRWALEVDHVTWHGGRFDAQRDKARDRAARLIGWQVDRVTDQELADDFESAIGELVRLHQHRTRTVAA